MPPQVRRLRPDEIRPASESFGVDGPGPVPLACGPVASRDGARRPGAAAVAGPDAVAGTVLTLVAEVLGGDRRVSAGDDLFELEFDSLMMAKLAARVYQHLGAELPLRAYFEADSIADVIVAVQAAVPA